MMVDFGVDPRAVDTMCLAELSSMLSGLADRRGSAAAPSREEMDEKFSEFAEFVSSDPKVRLN